MRTVLDEHLTEMDGPTVDAILGIFNPIVWRWFHQHQDETVRKIWFWTIRVGDLKNFVELIVGREA